MKVVFVKQWGPHQIGERDNFPDEIANSLIRAGWCKEYKGILKLGDTKQYNGHKHKQLGEPNS